MKNVCFLFLCALPFTSGAQAVASIHLLFQTPLPQGDFQKTGGPAAGYGGRMNFYLRPRIDFPFQFGLDIGVYGRGHADEKLTVPIAGFQEEYEIHAQNEAGNFGFLLQFDPWTRRRLRPYLEAELGGNVFYSNVDFMRKNGDGGQITFAKRDDTRNRWAVFGGGSVGMKIALGRFRFGGIDLKGTYLKGGKTTYNARPRFDDLGNVVFERLHSTTDLLVPQVGFWINFGGAIRERAIQARQTSTF